MFWIYVYLDELIGLGLGFFCNVIVEGDLVMIIVDLDGNVLFIIIVDLDGNVLLFVFWIFVCDSFVKVFF